MTFLFALRCLATNVLIDNTPTREPTEVSVVDEEICVNLAAYVIGVAGLFWIRAIHCVRWDTLAFQEFHGLVQLCAVAVCPQDETVSIRLQHFQRFDGEGHGLANGWIPILDHGAVEVNCDEQAFLHHPLG